MDSHKIPGPPYPATTAGLGGVPVPHVDDPICAVLLLFFVAAAATNMTIFRINLRRDHKFVFSAMTFGFCMARIVAMVMRIVWASRPHNVRIAIAANIFTLAGVILLFLFNLIFSQRILRAYRPTIGWRKDVSIGFRVLFFSILACLFMLIAATIDSFYTLNPRIKLIDRKIQLVGSTWFAILAFLPLPINLATVFLPLPGSPAPLSLRSQPVDPFGQGRMITKLRLVLFTSTLLSLGASFRAGTAYLPRPLAHPAWYHHKACYYCFNFVIELIVVYTYTIVRFDRRFHVPNGASAVRHYSSGSSSGSEESVNTAVEPKADEETPRCGAGAGGGDNEENSDGAPLGRKTSLLERINTESDVFGDNNHPKTQDEQAAAWERRARRELRREEQGEAV